VIRVDSRGTAGRRRDGAIDTVIAAFTDMQGRLMGKRHHAEFFLDELDAGVDGGGLQHLLALEMEMDCAGYAPRELGAGYGDFRAQARPRDAPADSVARATALRPLRRPVARRLAGCGPRPASTERAARAGEGNGLRGRVRLELGSSSSRGYEEAHAKHYLDLDASVPYILDYQSSLRLRLAVHAGDPDGDEGGGLRVESSKGEAWPDSTRSTSATRWGESRDDHVIYKTGAKELAHQCGCRSRSWRSPTHWSAPLSHPLVAVARR